jgi:hypothetical protein
MAPNVARGSRPSRRFGIDVEADQNRRDQMLRLSALVGLYKALALYFDSPLSDQWVKLENTGPLFDGQRPLARMIEGGLPTIIAVRTYVDALRGGA